MDEPSIRLLDSVHIDDDRQYVEFRFRGFAGEREAVQIDFEYVESLAAIFQQAFVSAALETQQGSTRQFGPDWLSMPLASMSIILSGSPLSIMAIMQGRGDVSARLAVSGIIRPEGKDGASVGHCLRLRPATNCGNRPRRRRTVQSIGIQRSTSSGSVDRFWRGRARPTVGRDRRHALDLPRLGDEGHCTPIGCPQRQYQVLAVLGGIHRPGIQRLDGAGFDLSRQRGQHRVQTIRRQRQRGAFAVPGRAAPAKAACGRATAAR